MKDNHLLQIITFCFLGLTLILGIFLRIYRSTQLSPYIDEASIGYNAYLVTKYHLDEWQSRWPLHFQAFGEWKLPVYIYTVSLIGKIIGFNTLTIRLPSILAGLGTGVLIFIFLKRYRFPFLLNFLGVNFYLLNFWSFMVSRGGFEANLALFFFLVSVVIYLSNLNPILKLSLTTTSLILAFFTYNGARIEAPLIFLLISLHFFLHHHSQPRLLIKSFVLPLIFWTTILILMWRFYHNPTAFNRFTQVHSRLHIKQLISTYLNSFSYSFWVGQGDKIIRHSQPGFGNSDIFSYFLFLVGGVFLLLKKELKKLSSFLFLWLLALLPGLITTHPLHNLRDILLILLFLSLIYYSLFILYSSIESSSKKLFFIILTNFILLISTFSFYHHYFQYYLNDPYLAWGKGYQQVIRYLFQKYPNSEVFIDDSRRVQPYIYWAWYLKIPPKKLVRNTPDKWYLSSVSQIKNIHFQKLTNPEHCFYNICFSFYKTHDIFK